MLLILDVDGVLTDGKKYYDSSGKACFKTFCDRDFTAIKKIKAAGVKVVFLSGDPNINQSIANNRNIPFFCSRVANQMVDKAGFVSVFEKLFNVESEDMIYVGDDIFDIGIMNVVGHAYCPQDAALEVRKIATVLPAKGGESCIDCLYHILLRKKFIKAPTIEQVMDLDHYERI